MAAKTAVQLRFGVRPGPGKLIAVEGLDGAGKTTVTKDLRDYIASLGIEVVSTRIPSDKMRQSEFFQLLQQQGRTDLVNPLAFEVEYMVDRIQHCRSFIEPALRGGSWVLTDRYALSSIGSLLLRLPELKEVAMSALSGDAWFPDLCRHLVKPDLCLLLHAAPQTTVSRLNAREGEVDRNIDVSEYGFLQMFLCDVARANEMVFIDTDRPIGETLAECRSLIDRLCAVECDP